MSGRLRALFAVIVLVALLALAWLVRTDAPALEPRKAATGGLRIVSLAPSVTEIVFAIGQGDLLIGATDSCDYPPEARGIERIGGFGAPNLERLLALKPDVVIASGLERTEDIAILERCGIRFLNVQIRGIDELFDSIRQIGQATSAGSRAEALVASMQADLRAVSARCDTSRGERRPTVFVEIGDHPLMTVGATSFLDDLIARAGGVNAAHGLTQSYPILNPEQVLAWDPDVILVTSMNRSSEPALSLARRTGWANLTAVKQRRIIDDVDPAILLRPGPRLVQGVHALAERLHSLIPPGAPKVQNATTR